MKKNGDLDFPICTIAMTKIYGKSDMKVKNNKPEINFFYVKHTNLLFKLLRKLGKPKFKRVSIRARLAPVTKLWPK